MKKQSGRPKLDADNAKIVLVAARFSPNDAKKLSEAASASGLNKSDWIRKKLLSGLDKF